MIDNIRYTIKLIKELEKFKDEHYTNVYNTFNKKPLINYKKMDYAIRQINNISKYDGIKELENFGSDIDDVYSDMTIVIEQQNERNTELMNYIEELYVKMLNITDEVYYISIENDNIIKQVLKYRQINKLIKY